MFSYRKFLTIWNEVDGADKKRTNEIIERYTRSAYFRNIFSDYEMSLLISLISKLHRCKLFSQVLAVSGYSKEKFSEAFDLPQDLLNRWLRNPEDFPEKLKCEFAFYICTNFLEDRHHCICQGCNEEFLTMKFSKYCPDCDEGKTELDDAGMAQEIPVSDKIKIELIVRHAK